MVEPKARRLWSRLSLFEFHQGIQHRLVVHDPSNRGNDPAYDSEKLHKTLLDPFNSHYRGCDNFKIEGDVDPELAATITTTVTTAEILDPDDFLSDMTTCKNVGNDESRRNRYEEARHAYRLALMKITAFRNSALYPRYKREFPPTFFDALAELYFTLISNKLQATLSMKIARGTFRGTRMLDPETFADLESVLNEQGLAGAMRERKVAMEAGEIFASNWIPSPLQQGKLYFRIALLSRGAGNFWQAERFISDAARMQPADALIAQALAEIQASVRLHYASNIYH